MYQLYFFLLFLFTFMYICVHVCHPWTSFDFQSYGTMKPGGSYAWDAGLDDSFQANKSVCYKLPKQSGVAYFAIFYSYSCDWCRCSPISSPKMKTMTRRGKYMHSTRHHYAEKGGHDHSVDVGHQTMTTSATTSTMTLATKTMKRLTTTETTTLTTTMMTRLATVGGQG